MNSRNETIEKFLTALKVDSVKDIKYLGKNLNGTCVCGQPIKHCYKFFNVKNKKECFVGKNCLKYVLEYIKI